MEKEKNIEKVAFYESSGIDSELGKNFNSNVVDFLKQEEKLLKEKANKMLENHDFAMYTKLINAYENVVELISKYDWKLMYSEYEKQVDGEHSQKQIAVWEQNGDGQIRNHKVWDIIDNTNCNNPINNITFNIDVDKIKDINDLVEMFKNLKARM